jgi:hypothetical protein
MKRILFNLLPAIFLWLGSCCIANAQATGDQITNDNQIIQADSTSTGSFETVSVDASSTSNVVLQFLSNEAGKSVVIQPLDGGTLSSTPTAIDSNGSLTFSFQVSDEPGVHRVVVIDPNADIDSPKIIALVQFEVPDPAE